MTSPIIEQCGYSASHPWYYVLGGAIPRLTHIREYAIERGYPGYLSNEIQKADKKAEPNRSAAIEKLRKSVIDEMRRDISRYRQAARDLRVLRDRQTTQNIEPTCDGVHIAISLKFNHLINGFAHLYHLDGLRKQLDLFGI